MTESLRQFKPEDVSVHTLDGLHTMLYRSFNAVKADIIQELQIGEGPLAQYMFYFQAMAEKGQMFMDNEIRFQLANARGVSMADNWFARVPNIQMGSPLDTTLRHFDKSLIMGDRMQLLPKSVVYPVCDGFGVQLVDMVTVESRKTPNQPRMPIILPIVEGFVWSDELLAHYTDLAERYFHMFDVLDAVQVQVRINPNETKGAQEHRLNAIYTVEGFLRGVRELTEVYGRYDLTTQILGRSMKNIIVNPRWFLLPNAPPIMAEHMVRESAHHPLIATFTTIIPGYYTAEIVTIIDQMQKVHRERKDAWYDREVYSITPDRRVSVGQLLTGHAQDQGSVNGAYSNAMFTAEQLLNAFHTTQDKLYTRILATKQLDETAHRVLLSALTVNEMGAAGYILGRQNAIQSLLSQVL